MEYTDSSKFIQIKQFANVRKNRRSRLKKKARNIHKNRGSGKEKIRYTKNKYTSVVENVTINGGIRFTLFEDSENVIELVNKLDRFKKVGNKIRNVRIDLSLIETIDIGAISFLLAKINEISNNQRIKIWGNIPINPECRKIFDESGFLDYMTDLSGNKFKKQSDNFIIKVGSDRTRNEIVGKTIEKSLKHLTGVEQKYPPVYSIVQEICSNSVEWANSKHNRNINWFFGVSHSQDINNPSVTFIMTDVGYGIVNTLNRKFGTYIKESLKITKDTEILQRAFDRKYGSKSGEANRNRGLPMVKDRFSKKYIKDLIVITNNVHLDFNNGENNKLIEKNLPGTFYCWKIDLKCLEIWNQIEIN